jgi:tetratricopeptide (TPR) repeat protein/curli biogenesis system outer membrane secretion channel CsgG
MKTFLKFLFLLTLTFMFGCATTIKVKLLKPAEVNLGARKKIAVLNFDFQGNINKLDYSMYYNTSFDSREITGSIIQSLVNNQHFAVVEREQLAKIMSEQSLSATGFVDKNAAIRMGKLFGVDALMVGSGEYYVTDTVSRSEESKAFTNMVVYYKEAVLKRRVNVAITYRVIDTETGEILVSRNLSNAMESATAPFPEKGSERIQYSNPGTIYSDPFKQPAVNPSVDDIEYYTIEEKFSSLQDWQTIAQTIISGISQQIVYQIAPHYVEENREIKDGESGPMKEGLEYARKGLWANAKVAWEALVNDSGTAAKDKTAALYNLGTFYEMSGDLEKSAWYFAEAYKNSGDEQYLRDKARVEKRVQEVEILKSQGRQDDLETSKDNTNYLELARKYYNSGEKEKAVDAYNSALISDPANDSVYYNLGLIYQEQNKKDKAIAAFNKTVQLNPRNADAYNQLGKLYSEAGNTDESIEAFKRAYAINPSLAKSSGLDAAQQQVTAQTDHVALGIKYYNEGNYNEAIREYKQALELNAGDASIHNNLAVTYYMQGNFNEAISHYKEAIRLNPSDASRYYNLALLYQNQGKTAEASEQYKKACEMGFKPACEIIKQQ